MIKIIRGHPSSDMPHTCHTRLRTHRSAEELVVSKGGRIGFWRGDIKGLVDDIGALQPIHHAVHPGANRVHIPGRHP